jgi:predicted DNA-binding transcriptional regulator AlpA
MTGRRPPLSARELREQNLPRRGLRCRESATYCGFGEKMFRQLVKQGRAPQPKQVSTGRSLIDIWTIEQLDEFLDRLPSRGDSAGTPGAPVRRLFNL